MMARRTGLISLSFDAAFKRHHFENRGEQQEAARDAKGGERYAQPRQQRSPNSSARSRPNKKGDHNRLKPDLALERLGIQPVEANGAQASRVNHHKRVTRAETSAVIIAETNAKMSATKPASPSASVEVSQARTFYRGLTCAVGPGMGLKAPRQALQPTKREDFMGHLSARLAGTAPLATILAITVAGCRRWRCQAQAETANIQNHPRHIRHRHVKGRLRLDAVFGMKCHAQAENDFNKVKQSCDQFGPDGAGRSGESDLERSASTPLHRSRSAEGRLRQSPEYLKKIMTGWADGLNYFLATHPNVKPKYTARITTLDGLHRFEQHWR